MDLKVGTKELEKILNRLEPLEKLKSSLYEFQTLIKSIMRVKSINGTSQNVCRCGRWLQH